MIPWKRTAKHTKREDNNIIVHTWYQLVKIVLLF